MAEEGVIVWVVPVLEGALVVVVLFEVAGCVVVGLNIELLGII